MAFKVSYKTSKLKAFDALGAGDFFEYHSQILQKLDLFSCTEYKQDGCNWTQLASELSSGMVRSMSPTTTVRHLLNVELVVH